MWLSASGQSAAMRIAINRVTALHVSGCRSRWGTTSISSAIARIVGRTNHGPIGRNSSAIAVSRNATSTCEETSRPGASWRASGYDVDEGSEWLLCCVKRGSIEVCTPDGDADTRDRTLIPLLTCDNVLGQLTQQPFRGERCRAGRNRFERRWN